MHLTFRLIIRAWEFRLGKSNWQTLKKPSSLLFPRGWVLWRGPTLQEVSLESVWTRNLIRFTVKNCFVDFLLRPPLSSTPPKIRAIGFSVLIPFLSEKEGSSRQEEPEKKGKSKKERKNELLSQAFSLRLTASFLILLIAPSLSLVPS